MNSSCLKLMTSTRLGIHAKRLLHSSTPLAGSGAKNVLKEDVLGLRRDITDTYSSAETDLFNLAVKDFAPVQRKTEVNPLFGTIPAMKATSKFLLNEMGLKSAELQIEEHYYQQLRSPLPRRSKIHTIVQLADIVSRGARDAMIIVDAATRDDNEVFLSFNQFCFRVHGRSDLSRGHFSNRKVREKKNPLDGGLPLFWQVHALNTDQESIFCRLLNRPSPLSVPTQDLETLLQDEHYDPTVDYDSYYNSLDHLSSTSMVANVVIKRLNLPINGLKGVKVLRGPKIIKPNDKLNVSVWRTGRRLIFFSAYNENLRRSDWTHAGYITLY